MHCLFFFRPTPSWLPPGRYNQNMHCLDGAKLKNICRTVQVLPECLRLSKVPAAHCSIAKTKGQPEIQNKDHWLRPATTYSPYRIRSKRQRDQATEQPSRHNNTNELRDEPTPTKIGEREDVKVAGVCVCIVGSTVLSHP